MDSLKAISYRRWRKRAENKGLSNRCFGVGQTSPTGAERWDGVRFDFESGDSENMKLRRFAIDHCLDEKQTRKLVKELEREFDKTVVFRKEKVAELKRKIRSGEYQVSGRAVAEKWFSESSEAKS
jgi:anti-sigma28 factor (negative regulator of flagellin synthesis)